MKQPCNLLLQPKFYNTIFARLIHAQLRRSEKFRFEPIEITGSLQLPDDTHGFDVPVYRCHKPGQTEAEEDVHAVAPRHITDAVVCVLLVQSCGLTGE